MLIAKINANNELVEYPCSLSMVRNAYKNVSFDFNKDDCFEGKPYVFVEETIPPSIGNTERLIESAPVWDGVKFVQTWVVEAKTQEEIDGELQDKRSLMWENIKDIRDEKTENGGYRIGAYWFHSDNKSRTQQLGLARKADAVEASGGDMDAPFVYDSEPLWWKTMSGEFVSMTASLAKAIFDAAAEQDVAIFKHAEYLKSLVDNSDSPQSININVGWPETYGA